MPTEKEHPKLIKTIGSPNYGNVQCSLQDEAGNLWFGTTENGLYQ
ncbi:MAG: two-component regulator propeller domain-containing protein, partial [Cytophagales bacterium]